MAHLRCHEVIRIRAITEVSVDADGRVVFAFELVLGWILRVVVVVVRANTRDGFAHTGQLQQAFDLMQYKSQNNTRVF
jgi:hypothetical protein